ncbi:MAG: hypothetical protein PHE51_10400 [Eubacteriales bacterium]|nr:hypothetical protein [Eubacteriales bacterium]
MLKKFIDRYTVKDVPKNGVIIMDILNENDEIVEVQTGVSNIPIAFENDIKLANKNGYYEYAEDEVPAYNEETEYLTYEYEFADNVIRKKYSIKETDDEVVE